MNDPPAGGAAPSIRLASPEDVPSLGPLWRRLYEDQREQGMIVRVPADGFEEWAATMRPVLGRYGCVVVAESAGGIVGFVAGRIRNLPRHFGGGGAGFISDVWMEPSHRGHGTGAAMVRMAAAWFRAHGTSRVELQVVTGNAAARRLYARLGFVEELVQMVLEQ